MNSNHTIKPDETPAQAFVEGALGGVVIGLLLGWFLAKLAGVV